jgi:hypothetical protein
MQKIYGYLVGLAQGTLGLAFVALYFGGTIGLFVGWAYWMWMAIHLGSFGMFVVGFLGPVAVLAGALGLWSLVFGIPGWLG